MTCGGRGRVPMAYGFDGRGVRYGFDGFPSGWPAASRHEVARVTRRAMGSAHGLGHGVASSPAGSWRGGGVGSLFGVCTCPAWSGPGGGHHGVCPSGWSPWGAHDQGGQGVEHVTRGAGSPFWGVTGHARATGPVPESEPDSHRGAHGLGGGGGIAMSSRTRARREYTRVGVPELAGGRARARLVCPSRRCFGVGPCQVPGFPFWGATGRLRCIGPVSGLRCVGVELGQAVRVKSSEPVRPRGARPVREGVGWGEGVTRGSLRAAGRNFHSGRGPGSGGF